MGQMFSTYIPYDEENQEASAQHFCETSERLGYHIGYRKQYQPYYFYTDDPDIQVDQDQVWNQIFAEMKNN